MASRVIEIQVTGSEGNYTAMVNRIIEKNQQLNRAAIQGAQQTANAFQNVTSVLVRLPSILGNVAGAFGAAFGVGAIIAFTKNIIDAAGRIDDLAKRTGFSRQTLSGLKSTIEENGSSLEAFATAVSKAQKSLADVEGDGKKAAAAFKAMGLDVNQLVKASPEQFFERFAEGLSKVENQNQRAAIATRVMGRAGAEQIPVVLELADKFKTLRETGVSEDTIRLLDKFGDALTRLKNQIIGFIQQEAIAKFLNFFDRLYGISQQAQAQNAITNASRNLAALDAQIKGLQDTAENKRTETLRRFGFNVPDNAAQVAELQSKRAAAASELASAVRNLERLQAEENRPPAGVGGAIGFDSPEKENQIKRAAEAVEQAKTQLAQLNLASAEARRAAGDLTVNVKELAFALIDQETAAKLTAAANDKILTPALRNLIEAQAAAKKAQIEAGEADRERKQYIDAANVALEQEAELAKTRAEAGDLYAKSIANENQERLTQIELTKQIADAEADRLIVLGRTTEAERLRLQNQLQYLEAKRAAEISDANQVKLRDAQIATTQAQIEKLGTVTINVGQTIATALGDAFEGVILGTSKLSDVGKNLLSALLRDIGQFFTQALIKKLGFENILLSNVQSFAPQMAAAGGTGSGGGGPLGFIGNLFGGQGGGGGLGNLLSIGSNLIGGGGTGGSGFSLGIGDIFSGISALFQGGAVGFSPGALSSAGLGGMGLGGPGGLSSGSMFAGFASALPLLGGVLGGFLGGRNGNTGLGIAGGLSGAVLGTSASAFLGGGAGLLGTLAPALTPLFSNPWTAIIAAIILIIVSILGSQKPNPGVEVNSNIGGFLYDALQNQFVAGNVTSRGRGFEGIPGSVVKQTTTQVEKILEDLSKQWTDILNLFPEIVHSQMIPSLERTNALLNSLFGRLKFTEGGSASISDEINRLAERTGPEGFFHALRGTIGAGLIATLGRAGLGDLSSFVNQSFSELPEGISSLQAARLAPGLTAPRKTEDIQNFFSAVGKFVGISGQLATISPRGLGQFLTGQDLARVTAQFEDILSITDGNAFTAAVDKLEQKLQPVMQFLQQSIQTTTDIFGRGLIAALEAASESSAVQAFRQNLGEGVKEVLFNGIVQAFIASAQFNDLLAPIQQIIRQFTQEATQTGVPPDIDAFRRAILPGVEAIIGRADVLGALLGELQRLGVTFRDALAPLTGEEDEVAPAPVGPIVINVYSNQQAADELAALLRGRGIGRQ